MEKFLVLIFITGLLCSGSESFKITDKEYENIDRILQFGVQVFLNGLDKVKEATEKLVKDDMLRTNRIAIQGHWNAFRDTANRISVEERGKGEMDDLIVAARTFQRLVGHYKDDAKNIFHTVIVEQNVRLYLPPIDTFKGTIERSKVNEVWGNLVENYFPDAPPIENQPLDFLCYLLSTSAAESFIVNVVKFGMEAISQYKKSDFRKAYERLEESFSAVYGKYLEIQEIEREKEKDDFLLFTSAASRVIVVYWDGYLNSVDTPELEKQYDAIIRKDAEQNVQNTLEETLKPITDFETIHDVLSEYFEISGEIYVIGLSPVMALYFADTTRVWRTARTVKMSSFVNAYPVYEQLHERGVFSGIRRMLSRAVDIATVLADNEEFRYLRETYNEKWRAFRKELIKRINEERKGLHYLLPQVRAVGRMVIAKFGAFVDRVNAEIDDDTAMILSKSYKIKDSCITRLLDSGALTQDQLHEARRVLEEDVMALYNKYLEFRQTTDPKRVDEAFKALFKAVVVGFNYIYFPLIQAWDFVLIQLIQTQ